MIKKKLLSLILAICMVMTLAPTIAFAGGDAQAQIEVKNSQNGYTQYKVNDGNWTELNTSQVWDINGISDGDTVTVSAVPNSGQELDTTGTQFCVNGFQETIDCTALQTEAGWSFTYTEGDRYQVCVEYRNGGDNPGPDGEPGGDENCLSIELCGNPSPSVSNGTFSYDHGTARVMFVRGSIDGAYDGSETRITLTDDVTAVKIILTADDGYQGELATGGNNPPVPDPEVNGRESTYTFERSAMEETGNFVAFNIEFTGESDGDNPGGDAPITWHTVSWGGGNVTVEHGTVAAERIHLGDKIFTVNAKESEASDSDNIYPIDDIIGEEGQEGLGEYGLGYGDTDLFIDDSVNEDVSIDFKFVPDYGYQLSDILANATESLLGDFTASMSEISTFNFAVRHDGGNVHFNVVFAAAEDTIDVTSTSVTNASIANGKNATDSGNLKMTVADIQEDAVSEELKAQAGESALYLDMNLYQIVSKGGEKGNWENQLEDLSGAITVALSVPAPAEGSSYIIVREHGDGDNKTYDRIEVTFVPDESDPTKGTVTFETDKFSNYALAQITRTPVDNSDVTPPSYDFLEGANGSWTQNSNGTLTFRANGDFSKFTGVKVDGTLIDAKNYTAVSGSTIVTLKADYLKTLSAGTHSLTVLFNDGECSTNFEVKKADSKQTEPTDPTKPENFDSPQTGDNNMIGLWIALLFVSGAGVAGTTIYSRKKKYSAK